MSLAQHVTAFEGVNHDVTGDDGASILSGGLRRPLNYNPLATIDPIESSEQIVHIATSKISTRKRLAQVVFGATLCCIASGIVFGFASLKPILIAEGVYSEYCEPIVDNGGNALDADAGPCTEQDMRLNLFFVAASMTANISALFTGYALDHFGRRACYLIAAALIAAGSLLLGFAFAIPEFDGYMLGNVLLSSGGTFLFVPSFRLADAFPEYSGIIVAVVTGSFDASAIVLVLYQMAWEGTDGSFTPSQFFFAYTIIPVILLVGEFTLMPRDGYQLTLNLGHTEKTQDPAIFLYDPDQEQEIRFTADTLTKVDDVIIEIEECEDRAQEIEATHETGSVWTVLHSLPAHRQMMTAWFILILVLTVLQMVKMNIFISTIKSQYQYLFSSEEEAETLTKFFSIALPLGGIVTTPFIGLLLNRLGLSAIIGVLTAFIAMIGVLNCLSFVWAGYATVILFVIFRPLYYSAMSDYATKVFGFATFGRLYGAITCISGVLSFSQYGVDALVHGPLGGDPTPINVVLTVTGSAVGLFLAVYVAVADKSHQKETLSVEYVQRERMPLIRGESEAYGAVV
ncbi:amino acid transporter [Nemania sp. FL0916]|nr:amino acid transporter [Nemania sp. FL0916]